MAGATLCEFQLKCAEFNPLPVLGLSSTLAHKVAQASAPEPESLAKAAWLPCKHTCLHKPSYCNASRATVALCSIDIGVQTYTGT